MNPSDLNNQLFKSNNSNNNNMPPPPAPNHQQQSVVFPPSHPNPNPPFPLSSSNSVHNTGPAVAAMAMMMMEDEEEEENRVVESDPTGRFERYSTCLGKGAYKEVFKAFDQEEGVEVAWNQLRLDGLNKRDVNGILSEIRILESLRNDNIINLFHSWTSKGKDGKERILFITEHMTSGTLKSYIRKTKGAIKPKVLKNWCRQILNGLVYLHSRDPPIIHRDLKCENIFINGNNGQAKIGDLGLATVKSRDHMSSVLGTPEFMAPELYDENYDEKVDIYAFGMVVLEIVTKEYPYSECTNQAQIYKKVSTGVKPLALQKITDEETRSFVELCILFDKNMRPSASEVLNHSFLSLASLGGGGVVGGGVSGSGMSGSFTGLLPAGSTASLDWISDGSKSQPAAVQISSSSLSFSTVESPQISVPPLNESLEDLRKPPSSVGQGRHHRIDSSSSLASSSSSLSSSATAAAAAAVFITNTSTSASLLPSSSSQTGDSQQQQLKRPQPPLSSQLPPAHPAPSTFSSTSAASQTSATLSESSASPPHRPTPTTIIPPSASSTSTTTSISTSTTNNNTSSPLDLSSGGALSSSNSSLSSSSNVATTSNQHSSDGGGENNARSTTAVSDEQQLPKPVLPKNILDSSSSSSSPVSSPVLAPQKSIGSGSGGGGNPSFEVIDAEIHTFQITQRTLPLTTHSGVSGQSPVTPVSTNLIVENLERKGDSEVLLKLIYVLPAKGAQEIKFPFNLSEDTATDVVSEMINENLIEAKDEQMARRKLEEAVRKILMSERSSTSTNASVDVSRASLSSTAVAYGGYSGVLDGTNAAHARSFSGAAELQAGLMMDSFRRNSEQDMHHQSSSSSSNSASARTSHHTSPESQEKYAVITRSSVPSSTMPLRGGSEHMYVAAYDVRLQQQQQQQFEQHQLQQQQERQQRQQQLQQIIYMPTSPVMNPYSSRSGSVSPPRRATSPALPPAMLPSTFNELDTSLSQQKKRSLPTSNLSSNIDGVPNQATTDQSLLNPSSLPSRPMTPTGGEYAVNPLTGQLIPLAQGESTSPIIEQQQTQTSRHHHQQQQKSSSSSYAPPQMLYQPMYIPSQLHNGGGKQQPPPNPFAHNISPRLIPMDSSSDRYPPAVGAPPPNSAYYYQRGISSSSAASSAESTVSSGGATTASTVPSLDRGTSSATAAAASGGSSSGPPSLSLPPAAWNQSDDSFHQQRNLEGSTVPSLNRQPQVTQYTTSFGPDGRQYYHQHSPSSTNRVELPMPISMSRQEYHQHMAAAYQQQQQQQQQLSHAPMDYFSSTSAIPAHYSEQQQQHFVPVYYTSAQPQHIPPNFNMNANTSQQQQIGTSTPFAPQMYQRTSSMGSNNSARLPSMQQQQQRQQMDVSNLTSSNNGSSSVEDGNGGVEHHHQPQQPSQSTSAAAPTLPSLATLLQQASLNAESPGKNRVLSPIVQQPQPPSNTAASSSSDAEKIDDEL